MKRYKVEHKHLYDHSAGEFVLYDDVLVSKNSNFIKIIDVNNGPMLIMKKDILRLKTQNENGNTLVEVYDNDGNMFETKQSIDEFL